MAPTRETNSDTQPVAHPALHPFAGRIGANQEFVLDPTNAQNQSTLMRLPDATPFISLSELFNLSGFLELELWKAAFIEGIGTLVLVWTTVWIAAHPPMSSPPAASPSSGIFSTSVFLAPLVGGITNTILVSLFIYGFGPISGGHLNPTITFSTFTARLTTFPRMVLYITFQSAGAALAGMLVRACYGSRDFATGGCNLDNDLVPTHEAFAIEFMADFTLLVLAFGVGLDPRQRNTLGPALAPVLVGLLVGVLSFGTAFSRSGYYGASLNPARCLGAFVGSTVPTYHWIHWIGPLVAGLVHGGLYWALPPWTYETVRMDQCSLG